MAAHTQKDKERVGDRGPLYIDGSQSVQRAPLSEGISPCLTPKSHMWTSILGRCLNGVEMMAYQGIDMNDFPAWREFSDALLRDLAGNAFSAPVFLCVLLSLLVNL